MLGTIRIVKEKDQSWKLIFNDHDYHIGTGDSGIMSVLKPKDNQICMITDLTSENAVCYFLIEDGHIKVFSLPDNQLRVSSSHYLEFFKGLNEGVKYYLIPVQ